MRHIHRALFIHMVILCAVMALACGCASSRRQHRARELSPASQPAEARVDQIQSLECPAKPPRAIAPFDGIKVFPDLREVHFEATMCLREGLLEQVACAPNTREHESLVVTRIKPSHIHASLLIAGFEPGAPGQWMYEEDSYRVEPPKGDAIGIEVRYVNSNTVEVQEPIQKWIRETIKDGSQAVGDEPWIFCGSRFETNPEFMGDGEHYVADMTGSIIGLVTFGDEVIGYSRVLADQSDVQEPVFEVNTQSVPAEGTVVTVILRRARSER
jgi:hypothetical protein